MKLASIQTFRNSEAAARTVVVIEHKGEGLSDYELDHLSDVVGSYLIAIGYDRVIGAKSVRPHLSDDELEREFEDFVVIRGEDVTDDLG